MWQNLKKRLFHWSPNHLPLGILFFAWVWIVIANTDLGTYFLGWDLMDSSFAPFWMIKRSLFETWQSFQGLGLLGGHGYAAQLPQAIIQLVLSLFIPEMYLRYAFTFLMLLSGIIGAYFLTDHVVPQKDTSKVTTKLPALAAGLVYLLHFGTVQNFYVALEPFIAMYGLLPWVLLHIFTLLKNPTIKNFAIFFVLNFFLSIIGFIPPVFFSYAVFLAVIFGTQLVVQKFSKQAILTTLVSAGIVTVTNLYWLTGVGVFTLTQNQDYLDSQLNQLTTQEFIYKNAAYGRIHNSIRLHGFLLDSYDQSRFEKTSGLEPIFTPWIAYLQNPIVAFFEYVLALLLFGGLLALIYAFIKTRRIEYSIGFLGVITLCLLTTATPPFSFVSEFFRMIPVLNQAFRIPYSKFSMSMVLFYSVGLGYLLCTTQVYLAEKIRNFKVPSQITAYIAPALVVLLLLITSLPTLTGNFLYAGARVALPKSYQELFAYMAKQPAHKRVAVLPMYTNTGWEMHSWGIKKGYTGSGFYWYGMRQPILSRSFDVWSPYNENYRNEMVRAVYNQDQQLFMELVDKYDISYVLVDKTAFLPNVPKEDFYLPQISALIGSTALFDIQIDTNTLTLYELADDTNAKVYIPQSHTKVSSLPQRILSDPLFQTTPNYLEKAESPEVTFAQLAEPQLDTVTYTEDKVFITAPITSSQSAALQIPSFENKNISFNVFFLQTDSTAQVILEPLLPELQQGTNKILEIPELSIQLAEPIPYTQTAEILLNQNSFAFTPRAGQIIPVGTLQVPFGSQISVLVGSNSAYTASDFWQPLQNLPVSVALQDSSQLTASMPIQRVYWDMQASTETSIVNCGLNQNGKISKKLVSAGIEYTAADKAASCDFIFIDNLPITQGYLVHVKGENLSGDPLKFVAINSESKYPVVTQKVKTGDFDHWFHILPSSQVDGSGYQFLLENQSYGSQTTKNIVSEFSVYTVPSEFLLGIHTDTFEPTTTLSAAVTDYISIGTGIIFASIINPSARPVPLVLSESYNIGWVAFPGFNITQKLEHQKFNGWANAWIVQPGTTSVVIVFWPQLLTWLSIVILVGTSIYFYSKNRSGGAYLWSQPQVTLIQIYQMIMKKARLLLQGKLPK